MINWTVEKETTIMTLAHSKTLPLFSHYFELNRNTNNNKKTNKNENKLWRIRTLN